MAGKSRMDLWWGNVWRAREATALRRYRSPWHSPLRSLAVLVLIAQALMFGALLALFWLPSQAHAQSPQAERYKLTLRREAQLAWGLGAPVATFAAQVQQESGWAINARSPVGAQGLAQFMPATTEWVGTISPGLASRNAYNPTWSLRALVTYDLWLHNRIQAADACQRMAFTLAAYNGGLGWVYKRQARSPQRGVCFGATCAINPGITPAAQRENQAYPERILQLWEPRFSTWGPRSCP